VDDVLNATGQTAQKIAGLSTRHTEADVLTLITGFIRDAQEEIQGPNVLNIPKTIQKEVHVADGESSEFELGPEDTEGYIEYSVEDCLIEVVHCYFDCYKSAYRRLLPYPRDCDELITDDASSLWSGVTGGGALPSNNSTTKFSGDYSMQFIFTASGTVYAVLNKSIPIDQYGYIALAVRYVSGAVSEPTFTVTLRDEDGNEDAQTFTVNKTGAWFVIWIKIDNMTGSVDWENKKLARITISCDSAITFLLDMFNFNDGYCWNYPEGKLFVHEAENAGEEPFYKGRRIYVTHRYDPFLVSTPRNIKKACACLAGIDLLDFLKGIRLADTDFDMQTESGLPRGTRDPIAVTRRDLERKYEKALAATGYDYEFIPIRGE